jgi:hypothetical protein
VVLLAAGLGGWTLERRFRLVRRARRAVLGAVAESVGGLRARARLTRPPDRGEAPSPTPPGPPEGPGPPQGWPLGGSW